MNRCPVQSCTGVWCVCVCVRLREGVCERTQKCLCEHFQGSVHACMPNDIKEGRQPWVLPCAQNHLTQADASLKHCHTRWPAEKPGKSLIVPHISIVFCLYYFFFFYCPICLKRSQIPQRRENAKRLGHPGGRVISFPFSYFPNIFPEEPREFQQACAIF